jgi:mycoredoxin
MTETDPTPTDPISPSALAPSVGVTMYTTSWCGFCSRLKRGLQSEGIAYDEVNIEEVEGAAELVMAKNGGNRTVPTLVFADGSALTNPSVADVREQLARIA